MHKIEQTITSMEASEMLKKRHTDLLRDIRRYCEQLAESKIASGDFFIESTYRDANNQNRPCYNVTKKGCEFIAHKLTGTKGTIFTARYINRFHEMEEIILRQEEETTPWFIRKFRGKYIVLERDFIEITGVNIRKHKAFYREEYFIGGLDYNGWGWKCNNEEFREEYGFEYGEDDCMMYLYPSGVRKALRILETDQKVEMNKEANKILLEGLNTIIHSKKREPRMISSDSEDRKGLPVKINIVVQGNESENKDIVITV